MSEKKGLVKCILGFLLSILVIVGGAFGLNVQVNVEDAEHAETDVVETNEVETTTEEQVSATDEAVDTEQSIVDSTPTVDQEQSADEYVDEEVTESTDEQQTTVTEKGENYKNAELCLHKIWRLFLDGWNCTLDLSHYGRCKKVFYTHHEENSF